MSRVIAAVGNDAAVRPVLAAAAAFGRLYGADVQAVHVREDGMRTVDAAVAGAGVPLDVVSPPVVASIVRAAEAEDVAAVVVGARSIGPGARPAGHIALAVAVRLPRMLVVVPPEAAVPLRLRRILVPLNGSPESGAALAGTVELAARQAIAVVALHVHDVRSIPLFTEQPQHELESWATEFLNRHRVEHEHVELELRTGSVATHVLDVAGQRHVDLIALGWSQELEHGHAAVVREVLERSVVPVLLAPVRGTRRRDPVPPALAHSGG